MVPAGTQPLAELVDDGNHQLETSLGLLFLQLGKIPSGNLQKHAVGSGGGCNKAVTADDQAQLPECLASSQLVQYRVLARIGFHAKMNHTHLHDKHGLGHHVFDEYGCAGRDIPLAGDFGDQAQPGLGETSEKVAGFDRCNIAHESHL